MEAVVLGSRATVVLPPSEKITVPKFAYRRDVDGLRAVAILGVLAFHAAPQSMPGGFTGVDVFFVISGFLISGLIMSEMDCGKFSFSNFYARRARRLFPALVVVLCAVWLLGWLMLLPDEFQRLGEQMAAGAGFSLNLALYYAAVPYFIQAGQLLHLWSLGVEEQFYLLWPIFIFALWKCGKNHFYVIALPITATSFILNIALLPRDPLASFYLPWNRLWELTLGGMLAHAQLFGGRGSFRMPTLLPRHISTYLKLYGCHVIGLLGVALLAVSFLKLNGAMDFPGWVALVPTAGTLLIISAGQRSWINRYILSAPIMVYIGLISYPLYLWHWPILSFTHLVETDETSTKGPIVAAIISALALAALTYRYVELPVRRSINGARVAGLLLIVVATCGVAGYLTFTQSIRARDYSYVAARLARADNGWKDWPFVDRGTKTWTANNGQFLTLGNGPSKVLYIGDSFMMQYISRISKILSDHPKNSHGAVFAVRGACPPVFNLAFIRGRGACRRHVQNAVAYANSGNVDRIVIGALWSIYFVSFKDGEYSLIPNAGRELDRLKEMIIGFRTRGKRVYVILPSPWNSKLDPRKRIRRVVASPGFEVVDISAPTRVEVEKYTGLIASKLIQIAKETGADVINPMEHLCNKATCPAISPAGEPIYVDAGHLQAQYAEENVTFLDGTVIDNLSDAEAPVSSSRQ